MTDGANNDHDLFADYLTEAEQAALLKKTVRTLRGWRKKRMGPAWTSNGKEVLYNRQWNREWLLANKQLPVRERRRSRRADSQAAA